MITNFVQGSNKNGGAGDNSCGGKSYDQAIVVAVQCTAVYIMYSLNDHWNYSYSWTILYSL